MNKQCAKCKQTYSSVEENFSKDKKRKDGFQPYCKKCQNEQRKGYDRKRIKSRKVKEISDGLKECTKCHERKPLTLEFYSISKSQRDGYHSYCKNCQKEYWDSYQKEKIEELNKKRKIRYSLNRETEIAKSIAYQKSHSETVKAIKKRHSTKQSKHIVERVRNWKFNNPIHARMLHQMHRAENIDVDIEGFTKIYKKYEIGENLYSCHYCGKHLSFSETTIDHVIPISKGGLNELSNIVIACLPCNIRKSNKIL